MEPTSEGTEWPEESKEWSGEQTQQRPRTLLLIGREEKVGNSQTDLLAPLQISTLDLQARRKRQMGTVHSQLSHVRILALPLLPTLGTSTQLQSKLNRTYHDDEPLSMELPGSTDLLFYLLRFSRPGPNSTAEQNHPFKKSQRRIPLSIRILEVNLVPTPLVYPGLEVTAVLLPTFHQVNAAAPNYFYLLR